MKAFNNILVYVDAATKNGAVLERAAQLAEHNQASLKIVDVVPEFHWPAKLVLHDYDHIEQLIAKERREQLQSLATTLCQREILVSTKVLVGRSSVEIIREVQRYKHDLVVCRSKGAHSKREGPLGNTSLKLLRHCPCAVWVSPNDAGPQVRRILVAVDPQAYDDAHAELNAALLELAKSLCETERCELMIAHIWNFFGEQLLRSRLTPRQVEELRAQERSNAEQSLGALVFQHELLVDSNKIILREGDPQVVIPELVAEKGIDLLIMGTVARGGVSGFMMGNTAETVVNRVNCSILALKPRTFVSSIRLEDEHHESVTIF